MLTYVRDGYLAGEPTPYMKTRDPFAVPADALSSAAAALELPPRLIERPKGSEQGAVGARRKARKPANRLRGSPVREAPRGRRVVACARPRAGSQRVALHARPLAGRRGVRRDVVRARGVAKVALHGAPRGPLPGRRRSCSAGSA